jgi:thymidylate synthase
MNKLDKDYIELLKDILENGIEKNTRNGKVLSVFGRQLRHKMKEGFPLLTSKKMYFKGIVTELLWFLEGKTDLRTLLERDNTIWVGDAYERYKKQLNGLEKTLTKEEFINKIKTDDRFNDLYGDLGPIYGFQWRNFTGVEFVYNESKNLVDYKLTHIDQIKNLINELKTNPDSRRLIVTAWNPVDLNQMALPPCHYGFQLYTKKLSLKERNEYYTSYFKDSSKTEEELDKMNIPTRTISLMWHQRSVDAPLGLPFNIASYGLLLEIIAKMVNMIPDELIGTLGDIHIYQNQIEGVKKQIKRSFFKLPTINMNATKTDTFWKDLSENLSLLTHLDIDSFGLENYQSHPTIKFPLSN